MILSKVRLCQKNRPPAEFVRLPDGTKAVRIPLTRGKWTVINEEDYPLVGKYNWYCSQHGYAVMKPPMVNGKRSGHVWMHRIIAGTPDGMITDHINLDKLCNLRSNLRTCDFSTNSHNKNPMKNNTSGHKGVSWIESEQCWRASIKFQKNTFNLGQHRNKEDAISARHYAASVLIGVGAREV